MITTSPSDFGFSVTDLGPVKRGLSNYGTNVQLYVNGLHTLTVFIHVSRALQ